MEVVMVRLFQSGGKFGYTKVDEYDNSKIWTDEFWYEKVRYSSTIKLRLPAKWMVLSVDFCISASCFLCPMRKLFSSHEFTFM